MAENQAYIFMVFTIVGMIIGVLFDTFRILRKTIKTKDFVTYIEDIVFWILTGIIIIYSMYLFCDGELRFFMVAGIIIGAIIYLLTISEYIIKMAMFIIDFVKKIILIPIKFIRKLINYFSNSIKKLFTPIGHLLKKIFFRPIFIICINFRKQFVKKMKKSRGFFKKKEKYNSI